jgi:prepilin-type N-terminal cleavage/methylation domain-containing protein
VLLVPLSQNMSLLKKDSAVGFTLAELLVVVVIAGLLAAIAAPGWLSFHRRQSLNAAREMALNAMRDAQISAMHHRQNWQASFRENGDRIEWAVHPARQLPAQAQWKSFPKFVEFDSETTLRMAQGVRRVQFNHLGHVNGQLGRLTFSASGDARMKRCVIVSTLLGALRSSATQRRPENGKYCW